MRFIVRKGLLFVCLFFKYIALKGISNDRPVMLRYVIVMLERVHWITLWSLRNDHQTDKAFWLHSDMHLFELLTSFHLSSPISWLDLNHFLSLQTNNDLVVKLEGEASQWYWLSLDLIISCSCQLSIKILWGKHVSSP